MTDRRYRILDRWVPLQTRFNLSKLDSEAAQLDLIVQSAQADAQSARTLALIAIVVSVVGVLVGVGAWLMRPKAASAPVPSTRPASADNEGDAPCPAEPYSVCWQ